MSRAASITGPWSQPVYLNSIGFDPSLLHDTDGKCYLVNMVNGFKGVLVQQMDPETGALLGERRKVYSGSGIGCTEGPASITLAAGTIWLWPKVVLGTPIVSRLRGQTTCSAPMRQCRTTRC